MIKNGIGDVKIGSILIIFLFAFCSKICNGRPLEPEYDNVRDLLITPAMAMTDTDSEPALIMLKHMWQSIQVSYFTKTVKFHHHSFRSFEINKYSFQELKRRQTEEEMPTFGQGIAQQLDVLRKLNRRQTERRRIADLAQDTELLDEALDKAFEGKPELQKPVDSHFPSAKEEQKEEEKIESAIA